MVATRDGHDSVLVVTHKRLIRLNISTDSVEILVRKAFWHGLYPNSMVVSPSGAIFVGMRRGVAKIENKRGLYKTSWLLPSKEFADKHPYKEGFK